MNTGPEKGPEFKGPMAPQPFGPPNYCAVYRPLPVITAQDRPIYVRRRRFWHLFACTVLLVTALHLMSSHRFHRADDFPSDWWSWLNNDHSDWQCADSANWTESAGGPPHLFNAHTSFTLPVTSDELYFVAEGGLLSGSFEISRTADAGSDSAIVDVDVAYYHPDALDDATVCRLHSSDNGWGMGIFTPRSWPREPHHNRNLYVHVHLRIPPSDALTVKKLRTNLPQFAHHLPALADTVFFDELSLMTSNAPIRAESLVGENVRLRSSNGAIEGRFNTSRSLELYTSNAPIVVHAILYNQIDGNTTRLAMRTSNGRVACDLALISTAPDETGGRFDVLARTSNAPFELNVVDAPVDSVLTTDAHTSNSPVRIGLHKTYEGSFRLSGSRFLRPSVEWGEVEDPAGRGRTRKVGVDSVRGGVVHGSVSWEGEDEGEGKVNVETSNSPLHLLL